MRKTVALFSLALIRGTLGLGQHFYAFYYDVSGGQDPSVNPLNTMPSDTGYVLKVYDAWGELDVDKGRYLNQL